MSKADVMWVDQTSRPKTMYDYARELEAERDSLKADAARYKYMRNSFRLERSYYFPRLTWELPFAIIGSVADRLDANLDSCIDAAIKGAA